MFEENSFIIGKEINNKKELSKLNAQKEEIQKKVNKLLDLRLSDEIDQTDYLRKRDELNALELRVQEKISEITNCQSKENSIEARVRAMKEVMDGKKEYDFSRIPEEIIEAFVDKIVVHEDYLEWHLKFEEPTKLKMSCIGQKKNAKVIFNGETTSNSVQQHRLQSSTRLNKSL